MDGVMPMSFDLTDANARTIGQQMQTGLTPFLNQMNEIMRRRGDELSRIGFGVMTLVIGTLSTLRGLRQGVPTVQVVNLDFLELMAAGSFAFLVLIFLKLHDLGRQLSFANVRLGLINENLVQLRNALAALEACVCGLLEAIHQDLVSIGFELTALGNTIVATLQAILAELRAGIKVSGVITLSGAVAVTITITGGGGGGFLDNVSWESILKLLAILGLLTLFVYALGYALKEFTVTSILALGAIALFIKEMIPLIELLGKLSGWDIFGIVVGLAALAGFVYVLGVALSKFSVEVLKALPQLSGFIDKLASLATTLAKLSAADIAGMVVGLGALAGFVYVLGAALSQFTADVLKALPGLGSFIDKLASLATTLAKLSAADIAGMVVGLGALASFVYVLGLALGQFSLDLLAALPNLSSFLNTLLNLATTLAGLSAWDLVGMAVGLALLAGFVYLLAQALDQIGVATLLALPGLTQLITALTTLATTLAGFGAGDLIVMGIGLALLTAAMFGIAYAIEIATPGLQALASVLSSVERGFDAVTSAASSALDAISSVGSAILSPIPIPSFQTGGIMPHTGMALLHEGEAVLNAGQTTGLQNTLGASAAQPVDQSVTIQGGITVNISAQHLDQAAAPQISEEIVRHLQERLGALRAEQNFRTGTRTPAPA